MNTYLNNTNDWMLKLVKKHEQSKRMYSITSNPKKDLDEINLSTDNISENLHLYKKQKN